MIPVFHWNDDSGKRPELFGLSVSKQHNSNVLLERWYQQHLRILQIALAQKLIWKFNVKWGANKNCCIKRPTRILSYECILYFS